MKRVFIIHGWGGYPEEGWFPWLKKELEKKGFSVTIPKMPSSDFPNLENWLTNLSNITGTISLNDFFVGHSLGCITIMKFLESQKSKNVKIGGAILVAAFSDTKTGKLQKVEPIQNFFRIPVNFEVVKNRCRKFVVINSDNDDYVSLKYGAIFKKKLKAKVIIEHNMRHFSGSDNVTRLPSALNSLLEISSKS